MAAEPVRLVQIDSEGVAVLRNGEDVEAFYTNRVGITFCWKGCTPYTISLKLLSETIKEKIYPEKKGGE